MKAVAQGNPCSSLTIHCTKPWQSDSMCGWIAARDCTWNWACENMRCSHLPIAVEMVITNMGSRNSSPNGEWSNDQVPKIPHLLLWATTNVGSLLPGCSSSHLRDLKQPLEVLHLSITLCPSSDLEQPRSCIAMDSMAAHAVRHCTWETATLHRSSIPSHLHRLSWSNGA